MCVRSLLVLIALAATLPLWSAQYALAPNGDDAASGTPQAPWRTIARANAAVQPGDTVTFLPGTYQGCLEPARSGEDSRPITFRAARPRTVILTGGQPAGTHRLCLRLKDRAHIVLEGLDMWPTNGGAWWLLEGCRYITLRDIIAQGGQGAYVPAQATDCHYCRFERLDVSRALQLDANGHVVGNMFGLNGCTHCVVQDCRFGKAGHDPFCLWPDCEYNVVRRCVFSCVWGRNFEFFTSPHTLIEQCVITNGYHGSGSADGRAKLFIWEGIFRHNVIYRNWYQPLTIHAYKYRDMAPFGMINSRLYHNTFALNYESGFEMFDIAAHPDPHMVRGNVLQNNLFAYNDPDGDGLALNLGANIAADNRFVSNLFYGNAAGAPTIRYVWPVPSPAGRQSSLRTAAEANRQRPEQFSGNLDAEPRFVAMERDDYRLGPGSPARDAGRPLAVATTSGSGRQLPVSDARMFYDGYAIPGETGDLIFIGPTRQQARVRRADSRTNILHLDRPVRWRQGDAVTLPYLGAAPDIGAYEAGADRQPWFAGPSVPEGLRIPTMETAEEPIVVTDFEAENLEAWFYWWYGHRQRGTQMRVDDTTAASGRRSLRVEATAEGANMGILLRPPGWDIDRFPYVHFSYRIPPGVPVGLWVMPMATEQRGEGAVVLGGSPARASGATPDLKRWELTDDGQWHSVTLDVRAIREVWPEVRLLRTLYLRTNDNGKPGQQYWIDAFRITREP